MNATRPYLLFVLAAIAIALSSGGLRADPMMPDTIPGLQLWLKADALGLADGAPVATWTDSSSAGHDAVATSSGAFVAPTFSATGIGDLPAVRFSQSAAELMQAANVFGDTAVTDSTIVALYRVDSNDERGRPVGFGANTGDGLSPNRHWNLAPDPSLRFDGSNIGSGNYVLSHPVDKYVIRSSLKSGQDFEEYFNGQLALPTITHGASLNVIDEFFLGDLHAVALPPGVTNSDVAEVAVFDRVLSAAERQGVEEYLQAKYFSAPPYWRFENGTAGQPDPGTPGNVLDQSAFADNGTAKTISGSLPTYSSDVPNAVVPATGAANTLSLDFEADNRNYVEIPHDGSLSFGDTPYTLEAWVKLETVGQASAAGRRYVMIKKTIGDADGFMDYALVAGKGNLRGNSDPDKVGLLFGRGTGNPDFTAVFSDLKITDNQWHYLSAAFDPATGEVRFTVDYNVDVQTTTDTPGGRNTGPLVLGAHFNASSVIDSPFDGLIDEVRVSPGVLGVDALMLTGFNDTRGYWRFENGTAGQPDPGTAGNVLDSSPFANHGTAMTGSGPLPAYSTDVPNSVVPATGQPNTLSLDFERDNDNYVAVPSDPSLSFADDNAFTLEAFVKLETVGNTNGAGGRQYVLLKKRTDGAVDSQMNYGLMAGPGNIGAANDPTSLALLLGQGTGGGSWTTVESDLQITDTEWHYISAAFDPAQDLVRFVLDDTVDLQSTTFSPGVNDGPLVIGAHFNGSGVIDSAFDGLIDEVRVSPGFLALDQLLNSRDAAAIPEPGTLILAALGGLALLWIRRRTQ